MPTRQGWTAVVAGATSFAAGRTFGLIELYVLGVGLIAIVVIAMFAVQRRPARLSTQRQVHPSIVHAGEQARVDLTLHNGDARTSPPLELWEPVGGRGGAPMQLAALRRGESASASYRVPTVARGSIELGPVQATRRDVLGLCRRTTEIPGGERLLVVPFHVPVPFASTGGGRLGEVLRMKAYAQTGNEFEALRDYVTGDDLRRVHWKATARSTGLIVRETAVEGVRRCTVVLDRDAGQFDHDGFERAVSAAASVVTGAAAAALGTRLVAADADLRGPTVAQDALRWLATVIPHRRDGRVAGGVTGGAAGISLGAGDGLGLVVVVTGAPSSPLLTELRRGLVPEETLVVVATRGAPVGRGLVVDASSFEAFLDGWAGLVHSRGPRAAGGRR